MLQTTNYKLEISFNEPLLGSQPGTGTPASDFVKDKVKDSLIKKAVKEGKTKDEAETMVDKDLTEEITLENEMDKAMTVFHRDEKGSPILYNYQIKGMLKECAKCLNGLDGMKAFRDKVEKAIFISPRRIPINGELGEPLERSLRVETPQGPRVCLAKSETVKAGATIECTIEVIDLPRTSLNEDIIRTLLEYGLRKGLGQWRNSGIYGQFTYELKKHLTTPTT